MSAPRHRLKGSSGRKVSEVERAREALVSLEPEYATLAEAIVALRPDIDGAIAKGHHVGKVYDLVAKQLKTTPHTVKSILQRAKQRKKK